MGIQSVERTFAVVGVLAGADPEEVPVAGIAEATDLPKSTVSRILSTLGDLGGLAIADGDHVRYVDQVRSRRAVRIRVYVGERTPLHTTAAGLVALAALDDDDLEAYLTGPLVPWGRGTSVDPSELRATVESVRIHDVAWTEEAWADGVNGGAVPVRDADGSLVAVLNAFGPSYRFPGERGRTDAAHCLFEAAGEIAGLLR